MTLTDLKTKIQNIRLPKRSLVLAAIVTALLAYCVMQPLVVPVAMVALLAAIAVTHRRDGLRTAFLKASAAAVAFAIAALAALWASPFFSLAGMLWLAPALFWLVVTAGSICWLVWRHRIGDRTSCWVVAGGVTASWAIVLSCAYQVLARNEAVLSLQIRNSLALVDEPLPFTIEDRLLPRITAETYMQNLNTEFMTSVEAPHLQLRPDGTLMWQGAVYGEDRWRGPLGSVSCVQSIDAARTEQTNAPASESAFWFGDRSRLVRAVFAVRHPFSRMEQCSYYRKADGTWTLLVSYSTLRPSFALPAPGLMVPCYGGVMEVSPRGWFSDWSPKQAAQRFPGAVLYPTALLRRQAEAYARWHDGWSATHLWQSGVLEISEDAGPDTELNPLPYVQHFRNLGLQLTVPLEPKGDKQWAFVEMLMADATSGQLRRVVPPKGLIGPRQARLNVRASNAMDWSQVRKIEPMLVVAPRGVFWKIALIAQNPGDPERHPYLTSVLVDARHANESFSFRTQKELQEFLAQTPPGE